jgi:hypothetical protein
MTVSMRHDNETLDVKFYRMKAAAYYVKARAVSDQKLKSEYESDAREYRYLAALLQQDKVS